MIATAARLADTVTWPGFKGKQLNDIISFRPMSDGRALRTAGLTKYTLSASGGTDRYNFFVSAAADQEDGVYFNNFQTLNTLRGNFSFVPTNKLTFATNIGLSHNHYRLPLNDNVPPAIIARTSPFPGARMRSRRAPSTRRSRRRSRTPTTTRPTRTVSSSARPLIIGPPRGSRITFALVSMSTSVARSCITRPIRARHTKRGSASISTTRRDSSPKGARSPTGSR
jgi:hypothetical protein